MGVVFIVSLHSHNPIDIFSGVEQSWAWTHGIDGFGVVFIVSFHLYSSIEIIYDWHFFFVSPTETPTSQPPTQSPLINNEIGIRTFITFSNDNSWILINACQDVGNRMQFLISLNTKLGNTFKIWSPPLFIT